MDHDMARQKQEPLTEKQQTRKLRSWVPWTVALVVLGAILVFAITVLFILKSQGINQGTVTILTILSIVVGTIVALLGLLFTFLQWFHSRPSSISESSNPAASSLHPAHIIVQVPSSPLLPQQSQSHTITLGLTGFSPSSPLPQQEEIIKNV